MEKCIYTGSNCHKEGISCYKENSRMIKFNKTKNYLKITFNQGCYCKQMKTWEPISQRLKKRKSRLDTLFRMAKEKEIKYYDKEKDKINTFKPSTIIIDDGVTKVKVGWAKWIEKKDLRMDNAKSIIAAIRKKRSEGK